MSKSIKEKLSLCQEMYGTWCMLPSPEVIDVISKTGLDFIIVDMEHGSMDYTIAQQMVSAAQAEGCGAIVRSSGKEESAILKSLDIGSDGVIVPHIATEYDLEDCIKYSKYHPVGNRSYSPYTRAGRYQVNYKKSYGDDSILGIIIEDPAGVNNVDELVENEHLDVVYVGTYDIAQWYGEPTDGKETMFRLERIAKVCRDNGKSVGCLFHDGRELNLFKSLGINFLVYKVDSKVLSDGFSKVEYWRNAEYEI